MTCVKTVTYAVRLNGEVLDKFTPSRGLRQGDPLSPYLFLFVADGLSKLLQKGTDEGQIRDLKVCKHSPSISHLLFANGNLLFFEANVDQANKVKVVLNKYEKATGQLLSLAKCSLRLENKCTEEEGHEVATILNIETMGFKEKHLGLPAPEQRKMGNSSPSKRKSRNVALTT
jgi:hypothetical protein